ncbi:hypothetical protein A9Q78_00750 [Methylophaga sp. 41_12_T18]|nr:hypothetical protein A9Q78_00750 [Methylophaga sp. 41_12_T18]
MILNTSSPKNSNNNTDDNMIPLINVVFLMLIFFMVAGQITAADGVKVAPPISVSDSQTNNEQLKVVIAEDGRVFIDGSLIEDKEITARILSYRLDQNADENTGILVKADADLAIERLQTILKLIKSAGISSLSLITSQVKA